MRPVSPPGMPKTNSMPASSSTRTRAWGTSMSAVVTGSSPRGGEARLRPGCQLVAALYGVLSAASRHRLGAGPGGPAGGCRATLPAGVRVPRGFALGSGPPTLHAWRIHHAVDPLRRVAIDTDPPAPRGAVPPRAAHRGVGLRVHLGRRSRVVPQPD